MIGDDIALLAGGWTFAGPVAEHFDDHAAPASRATPSGTLWSGVPADPADNRGPGMDLTPRGHGPSTVPQCPRPAGRGTGGADQAALPARAWPSSATSRTSGAVVARVA